MPRMSLPFRSLTAGLAVIALLGGCKKDFDSPPERTLPTGAVMTVAQLRALFTGSPVHFPDSAAQCVYAIVTADEQDGNLYKNVYVQDHTGGIIMRLMSSGGLYQGDSVRIYLPGTVLSSYQSMLQLDSVNVDNNVVKQATQVNVTPLSVSIAEVVAGHPNNRPDLTLQGMLVKLDNVEFAASDTGLTYADAVNQMSVNRTIEDCNNNSIIARNSGYSNYAALPIPNGKGSIVVNVSQYSSTVQLNIRSLGEVQMNGLRCGQSSQNCDPVANLTEGFDLVSNNATITGDQVACWTNTFTTGSRAWKGRTDGSNLCAEAAVVGFDASNIEWLVSPQLIFHSGITLSFDSEHTGWVHDGLTVWVSTDFSGDATTATWTQVSGLTIAGSSTAANTWQPSGSVVLDSAMPGGSAYTGNFVVAFKYSGSSAQNTVYRIDNVAVN